MAGKTDYLENYILRLLFNGNNIPNLADNASASPVTTLYISLHTADPTDAAASGQATSETTYTGYARIPVVRNTGGWVITGSSVSPVAAIEFGVCTAGTAAISHLGIGTESTGPGVLLFSGSITPAISVVNGVIPRITTASTITED